MSAVAAVDDDSAVLAALKKLVDALENRGEHAQRVALDLARAAIAKAEATR